ncbi:MAG: hypothetical protein JO210_05890 [Acidobacteriaceae bacterium]|nr:hypothetical protein [Acidobacteriaceae bacterium]
MLWKRISVSRNERILIARDGEFAGILTPGDYRLSIAGQMTLTLERHNVYDLVFESAWTDYLVEYRPATVRRHFIQIETNNLQVAMVYVNGKLFHVLVPGKHLLFWRGIASITAEVVDMIAAPELAAEKCSH